MKGSEVSSTSKELIGEKEIDESTAERCRIGFGCILRVLRFRLVSVSPCFQLSSIFIRKHHLLINRKGLRLIAWGRISEAHKSAHISPLWNRQDAQTL